MARIPKTLRRLVTLLLLAAVVEYLVLPQLAGARKALHLVSTANLWLALAGVGLEVASLLAYSKLTQAVLAPHRIGFGNVTRINLATMSVSHVVPGGTAAGASLGYRLLSESGVPKSDVGVALATQGVGSAVVLNLFLWVGLLVSIPLRGFSPLYVTAAVLGVLLIGFVAALIVLITRGEERAVRVLRAVARHTPLVKEDAAERVFRQIGGRLRELTSDRSLMVRAGAWAAANWLLDAASLWVFVAAFGHRPSIYGLVVAYGLANVLAAIPITPSGLGVVEGVLAPTLVGFGSPRGVAILGVLGWRLVNFWLPIPAGAAAYLSLRVGPGGLLRPEELQRLAEGPPDDLDAPGTASSSASAP
ncbi:MAG TPA: YbhN family protein [Acidimicrobiales bacterium]|nr:YbhN family protein [Acidimicrobiales bacterium]